MGIEIKVSHGVMSTSPTTDYSECMQCDVERKRINPIYISHQEWLTPVSIDDFLPNPYITSNYYSIVSPALSRQ